MGTQAPTTDTNTDHEYGVIKQTTNYNQFRYMGGNRIVDVKHVKELQQQMERNRDMFASMPILVNQDWYIIDGQHRFEAAKALSFPIYYVMQKHVGLSDARQLNIAQKRWGLIDFARSYSDSGRKDYTELLRVKHNYPRIPLSTVADYLNGRRGGGRSTDSFRRGDYQIVDMEDGIAALDILTEVIEIFQRPATGAFSAALWHAIHHEDFNSLAFLNKLKENPEKLTMSTSTRAALRNIEDIFNRHNRITVRLD